MSELFFNVVETTIYVCFTIVFILLASYSIFYFGKKKIEEIKKNKKTHRNLNYVVDWILGIGNKRVKAKIDEIIKELPSYLKTILPNNYREYIFYILSSEKFVKKDDVRDLILLCISYESQKIKKIFETEKKIQNKLAKVKSGNEKIKESEFLSYANLIQEKESEKNRIEELGKKIMSLGLLGEKFMKEFKEFILLYNPEEKKSEEESDPIMRRERPEKEKEEEDILNAELPLE